MEAAIEGEHGSALSSRDGEVQGVAGAQRQVVTISKAGSGLEVGPIRWKDPES